MQQKIAQRLVNIPAVKVMVIRNNSKESLRYSKEFEKPLKSAGWTIMGFSGSEALVRTPHKMKVAKNSKYVESRAFAALVDALVMCGLEFETATFEGDLTFEILFDPGVIEANEYQGALDKNQ